MKKSCIAKSTNVRKEIFAPNDSETQVSYLLVIHLSQSEKKVILEKRYFHV